jgi:hypothetical protein
MKLNELIRNITINKLFICKNHQIKKIIFMDLISIVCLNSPKILEVKLLI